MRWFWQRKPKTIVIGSQLALARERDAELRRSAGGPSPMPAGRYDDVSLIEPRPGALDDSIRRFCSDFAVRPAGIRNTLSMDDFYVLIAFAQRAAVFAIRERDRRWIADGLAAAAIIDDERIDWRDLYRPLELLRYAALRIGADATALFRDAARMATSSVAQRILAVGRETSSPAEAAAGMLLEEIDTPDGIGFIERDIDPYRPVRDLVQPALAIRAMLQGDHYAVGSVAVASRVPDVWFQSSSAEALLKHVTGAASVHAEHRADPEQIAMVFLGELDDPAIATELAGLAARAQMRDTAMLAVAHETLLCLLVMRSFVAETPSLETTASLHRFVEPLHAILGAAA